MGRDKEVWMQVFEGVEWTSSETQTFEPPPTSPEMLQKMDDIMDQWWRKRRASLMK